MSIIPSTMVRGQSCCDPVEILERMLSLFLDSIMLCAIIAVATLAAWQLIKPLVRGWTQQSLLRHWRRRVERERMRFGHDGMEAEAPSWLGQAIERRHLRGFLDKLRFDTKFPQPAKLISLHAPSNGHLMRQLQSAADLVLARPSESAAEFSALADGAAYDQVTAVLFLDAMSRKDPGFVASLMDVGPEAASATSFEPATPPKRQTAAAAAASAAAAAAAAEAKGIAAAIAAARDSVATAADRALDQLQLRVEGRYSSLERYCFVIIGVSIALAGCYMVSGRLFAFALALGATSGLLALAAQDAARGFVRRRG